LAGSLEQEVTTTGSIMKKTLMIAALLALVLAVAACGGKTPLKASPEPAPHSASPGSTAPVASPSTPQAAASPSSTAPVASPSTPQAAASPGSSSGGTPLAVDIPVAACSAYSSVPEQRNLVVIQFPTMEDWNTDWNTTLEEAPLQLALGTRYDIAALLNPVNGYILDSNGQGVDSALCADLVWLKYAPPPEGAALLTTALNDEGDAVTELVSLSHENVSVDSSPAQSYLEKAETAMTAFLTSVGDQNVKYTG
jgi:predicted small lipoprotein YifL